MFASVAVRVHSSPISQGCVAVERAETASRWTNIMEADKINWSVAFDHQRSRYQRSR